MSAIRAAMVATTRVAMATGYTGDPEELRESLLSAPLDAEVRPPVEHVEAPVEVPVRPASAGAVLDELAFMS